MHVGRHRSPAGGGIDGGGVRAHHTDNQFETELAAHLYFRQHRHTKHGAADRTLGHASCQAGSHRRGINRDRAESSRVHNEISPAPPAGIEHRAH